MSNDKMINLSLNNKEKTEIRTRLIQLQDKIQEANIPVILLLCGESASGKNTTLGVLRDWLNQRLVDLHAYHQPDSKKSSIEFKRYWCDTPENGHTGIFVSSWYSDPLVSNAYEKISDEELYKRLDECNSFEKMLSDSNAIICKIWFRKTKAEIEEQLRLLEENPYEKWRIMPNDWKNCCVSESFANTTKKIIKYTDKDYAPWIEIKEGNITERLKTALESFCEHVEDALPKIEKKIKEEKAETTEEKIKEKTPNFVKKIDIDANVSKEEYKEMLPYLRARLNALLMEAEKRDRKVILAFEGPDASGKGGVISRLAASIFVRDCNIFSIAAPTKKELNHNFLWRFWNRLNDQKLLTVFDRTWYGRVLVERVEHFATNKEWKRAYDEINQFEKTLTDGNNIVVKFLLYISKEEQLVRFKAREEIDYKKWKICDEDWRNRDKWELYDQAFDDMIEKTNTKYAPWFVVPDNNKKYGRLETIKLLCEHLEKELDYIPFKEAPVFEKKNGKKS